MATLFLCCQFQTPAKSSAKENLGNVGNSRDTDTLKYRKLSTFNLDTMNYLKYNFYDNKPYYLNKKLEKLLERLELDITLVLPVDTAYNTPTGFPYATYLEFRKTKRLSKEYIKSTTPSLLIIFKQRFEQKKLLLPNSWPTDYPKS